MNLINFASTLSMTATEEANPTTNMLMSLLPFVVLIVIFYFLLIRPQRKRDKAEQAMRTALEVGDEIVTRGGIVGVVTGIKDNTITIETGANKVRLCVERWAIQSKTEKIHD